MNIEEKFNEVNDKFQLLRFEKIKLEEEYLDTNTIELEMAFNNGQLNILRKLMTKE